MMLAKTHQQGSSRHRHLRGGPLCATGPGSKPGLPCTFPTGSNKAELVDRLISAKEKSGKTFSQISAEIGLTNVQTAALFFNQAQLKPEYAAKLKAAVPALTDEELAVMQRAPSRRFDPTLIQEPAIYRLYEAIMHNGEAIKALINEEAGDGIMSAIDFYCTIDTMPGKQGEKRIVITMNGKYLPYIAQASEDNVAKQAS